ncbi:conserved hypothetical protein [Theileria equi strain WA]|uniref:Uncharacterized protein n=1 Tax=Theileria equi strain WA TaxID=1537102 RepID=L1LCF9_THEEQ|nr:conserved hypothetical protein [Theileria equi strain WA]EKX73127.1 conserved hypothetical protein [Theileria equi strain WA]|eukprot:XP_004832579.1 conserved hypothetical protein [Theileria equi strain WA]
MDDLICVLSSMVSDRVRHYELVKITIHTSKRKLYILVADRGIYLVTYSLSGILEDGKIPYSNVKNVALDESKTKVVIELNESIIKHEEGNLGIYSMEIETPNHVLLYDKIKIAVDTNIMIQKFEESPEEEPITIVDEHTILPFNGYKKMTFGGYFFFVRDTFRDTTLKTLYNTRIEDDRGVTISIHVRDPNPIHHLEMEDPCDLYMYSRGFLNEVILILSKDKKNTHVPECNILRDEIYYKKMKLNNDIATWSCYHILVQMEKKVVAFFILRRLYIPPLLDMCQDISIRFDLTLEENSKTSVTEWWNEFCLTVNSFTANSQKFIWNKDLIQMRVDNLRFRSPMYSFLKNNYGIMPSYYKLIRGFIASTLKLLPPNVVDQSTIVKLEDPLSFSTDEPMEYIYKIVSQLFGVGSSKVTHSRKTLINNFTMRLADYISFCIDELILGKEISLSLLIRDVRSMDQNSRKKLHSILVFLMHFRSLDFTVDYSPKIFENIIDTYKRNGNFDWKRVTFNHFSVSRFLEDGYISVLFDDMDPRKFTWDPYILLMSSLLETFNSYTIHKRIFRKMLELPMPIPTTFLPLVPSFVHILQNNLHNSKTTPLLLSLLINFSYHSDELKESMMASNIAPTVIHYLLDEGDSVPLTLKLMTNLTKKKAHQDSFTQAGAISNIVLALKAYYKVNRDIVAYAAGVIGQLSNSSKFSDKLDYIADVMIYTFHTGAGSRENFEKILFCLRKIVVNRSILIKVGRHCIRTLIFNLKLEKENDYLMSIFELMLELANVVQNCKLMRHYGILDALNNLDVKVDSVVQVAIKLSTKIKKKTLHCNF